MSLRCFCFSLDFLKGPGFALISLGFELVGLVWGIGVKFLCNFVYVFLHHFFLLPFIFPPYSLGLFSVL